MTKKQPTKVRVPRASTLMRGIVTPEGFEREETTETWTWGREETTYPVLRLTSPDTTIQIDFNGRRDSYSLATGHVTFDTPMGERTFDRCGVEDSFYIDNPAMWNDPERRGRDPIAEANETIRKVIEERIPEVRDRLARSESVPTIPFSVTPEAKARITDALLNGQRHSFMPSGFGTGYELTADKLWSDSKRNPELARFFGVPEVWVSTFDAD